MIVVSIFYVIPALGMLLQLERVTTEILGQLRPLRMKHADCAPDKANLGRWWGLS